ncbi:hypothetical protein SDC9_204590 [bioreactor metagenome]|uniref:Uncharacterized protein n=1 Tax=bioreactor metagenome TaxID=1076179 RepID=A0A645J0G4_9ZZZZ
MNAVLGQRCGDLAGCGWANSRIIHKDQTRVCTGDNSFLAKDHFLDIWAIGQVGKDHIYLAGNFCWGRSAYRTQLYQFLHGSLTAVMHDEWKPGIQNVFGNGFSHQSQTDITDFHCFLLKISYR